MIMLLRIMYSLKHILYFGKFPFWISDAPVREAIESKASLRRRHEFKSEITSQAVSPMNLLISSCLVSVLETPLEFCLHLYCYMAFYVSHKICLGSRDKLLWKRKVEHDTWEHSKLYSNGVSQEQMMAAGSWMLCQYPVKAFAT